VEVAVESTGRACGGEVDCVCDFNLQLYNTLPVGSW
jgi:hypothetical protein